MENLQEQKIKKVEGLKNFPFKTFAELKKATTEGIANVGIDRGVALQWAQNGIYSSSWLRTQALILAFLPFVAAIVGVVLLALGLMIPAGPGFIGTYQFFVVTALGIYSVSESKALALALFLNLFVFALSTLLGLLALIVGGFSWSSCLRNSREAA